MADPRSLLLVGAGGAVGATARWMVVAGAATTGPFPWPTLLVNLVGCFGLGLLAPTSRSTALALGTGVCGGLTTFSTFGLELSMLLDDGDIAVASLYLVASVAGGLAAVMAGRQVVST